MTSSLWRPLLLGVVLIASYCFNSSKYLLNSSSNKLASVKASFWFPQNETRTYEHRKQNVLQDNNLFAFMMRDANRMVAIDPPFGMYIFDYINVHGESISASSNQMQLYLNGRKIGVAPCEEYSIRCYKAKMLQIFHYVANHTRSQYLFYMESDHTLCVPLSELKRIAQTQSRYFVGTGIGASGWIMSRPFLLDFMARYESGVDDDDRTDVVASKLLMEDKSNEKGWAVTRQYLVAHTLMQPIGGQGLTVRKPSQSNKRLPRCLEPHRGMWITEEKLGIGRKREDKYGWDYFDFDACPDSDIYPCNRPDVKKNRSSKGDSYTNIGNMKEPMHHCVVAASRSMLVQLGNGKPDFGKITSAKHIKTCYATMEPQKVQQTTHICI